jgi:death-on-curing protein
MREPRWVPELVVDAVHLDQLRAHGGMPGGRDRGALSAALARPQHAWTDRAGADLADLAAAYGFGLCRAHPFNDGNKRVAFVILEVFIELNGGLLEVTDDQVVQQMLGLAAGTVTEDALAAWIRAHLALR